MRGQLHHVEIYVSDLQKSRQFWDWLLTHLGYKNVNEWPQGVSWQLGGTYLVFVQTEDRFKDVEYHRCRTGLNHLAFHGGSRAEIDELTELLKTRDVKILYEDKHPYAGGPNYYAVFFEDPDRIKVEVVADE